MTEPKKSKTRDEINEATAQAMHSRTGYDLDACRADALMRQGLYEIRDSVEGLTQYLEAKNADVPTPEKSNDN